MVQFPDAARYSSPPQISKNFLGPIQPPSQLVPEFLHGIKQQELEADHSQPVPKLIMSETTPLFYHMPSWHAQKQHSVYINQYYLYHQIKRNLIRVLASTQEEMKKSF